VSDQPAETVNRLFLAGAARRAHRIAATVLQPPPEVDFNAWAGDHLVLGSEITPAGTILSASRSSA
jgi:hypothetical protein